MEQTESMNRTLHENNEPLSVLSDCSFVILGQGSLPCVEQSLQPSDLSSVPDLPRIESFITDQKSVDNEHTENGLGELKETSWTLDSTEDIQKKLDNLLRENYQLKETLNQNNLAMKQQFDNLVMWQDDVMKTHETHKQKFSETKELIFNLKTENAELKKVLSLKNIYNACHDKEKTLLQTQISTLEERINTLSSKEVGYVLKIQEMGEVVNSFMTKYKTAKTTNEQLSEENRILQNSVKDLDRENLELKNVLYSLKQDRVTQNRRGSKDIESYQVPDMSNLNISNTELMNDDKLTSMNSWMCFDKTKIIPDASEEQQLRNEVDVLKKCLIVEQGNTTEKQTALINVQQQFKSLYADYQSLLEKTKNYDEKTQQMNYIETVDALNNQLVTKNELLQRKEAEIVKLCETVRKLELQCENVAILQAQVEVYQSDFKAEREAREKVVDEKENISRELRELQRRNRELSEEVNKYRLTKTSNVAAVNTQTESAFEAPTAGSWVLNKIGFGSNRTSSSSSEERNLEEDLVPPKLFSCFKCEKAFRELRQLEEHVEECLELNKTN